jgi:hypothetical protein
VAVQEITEKALGNRIGAAVVMDISNGNILAMASHPTWDPNRLSQRMTPQEFRALINDRGVRVRTAEPSMPVKCLGLAGVPEAGAVHCHQTDLPPLLLAWLGSPVSFVALRFQPVLWPASPVKDEALTKLSLLGAPCAASRFSRGVTMPLRLSVTKVPLSVRRARRIVAVSLGKACAITATAPATSGAEKEVPPTVAPVTVINAPGANRLRKLALLEKQVTLSAALVLSVQAPQLALPTLAS